MKSVDICELFGSFDSTVGLAIIRSDYTVKWANQVHRAKWPDLVRSGETCYAHVNGFTKTCAWCPVAQTFADGKVHEELVCSPKRKGEDPDVVFANILSIPVLNRSREIAEVVEIIINATAREESESEYRSAKYQSFAGFGSLLERVSSYEHVPDFLALGAVSQKCLDFTKATVFTLVDTPERGRPQFRLITRLARSPVFKRLAEELERHKMPEDASALPAFRHRLRSQCLERTPYSKAPFPYLTDHMARGCVNTCVNSPRASSPDLVQAASMLA